MTKYEIKELRKLQRQACLARDNNCCLRCGKTDRLCASHIYPKGKYRKLEFNPENVKTLCFSCHIMWWHKHPLEASEWLKTAIPELRLKRLHLQSITTDKTILDYNLIKLDLEREIEKYE